MEINNPQCRDPLFWKEKQEEILDDQVYSTEI